MSEQNSGIIVLAALAAAALGGLAAYAWQGQPEASAEGAATRAATGEERKTREEAGEGESGNAAPEDKDSSFQSLSLGAVRIMYDAYRFELATEPGDMPADVAVPPCAGGFHYCFYARQAFTGTNFESAGVRVTVRHDLRSENECLQSRLPGFRNKKPNVRFGGAYAAAVFPDTGSAGAGHYTTGTMYRLYAGGACYELETRIAESSYPNYEPGSIRRFTESQRSAVRGELEELLSGMVIRGTIPVLLP